MRLSVFLLALVFSSFAWQTSKAQNHGDDIEIELITVGVGPDYWEAFGHTAIGLNQIAMIMFMALATLISTKRIFSLNLPKERVVIF